MADTALLGGTDSQPGNIILGLGATIPGPVDTNPATLVVEVAFNADPITTAGYYYNDINDGATSYWRMDSATSLVDQTGAGNTMTLENTPTLTTGLLSGDSNQATIFNGTTQGGYAASTAGLSPTGPFSVEMWITAPSSFPGSTVDLVSKRGSFRVQLTPAGKIVFSVKNHLLVYSSTSNTALQTSHTYHVACVYDGVFLKVFINGVVDSFAGYSGGVEATASQLRVASFDSSSASPAFGTFTIKGENNSTGIAPTKPASTADGDYLLAQLVIQQYSGALPTVSSAPAGWTLLASNTGAGVAMFTYGKVASGEPAAWGWGVSGPANLIASVTRYTGVSAAVPTGSSSTAGPVSGVASIASTILPAYDNTLIVSLFGGKLNGNGGTWTGSGAGTERVDYSPSVNASLSVYTNPLGTAASTTSTGTSQFTGELLAHQVELVGTLSPTYTAVTMDEISLFGFALTDAQILKHYNAAVVPPPTLVWTDISADVRTCETARGRQYELDRIEAGTANLMLNDDLRKYDPANTSSPYAPNVIPMRQIRIRALLGGTYYPIFQGYIERWESQWDPRYRDHVECQITAVDGFEPLSLASTAGTVQAALAGTTIAQLAGRANWPNDKRAFDTGAFMCSAITLQAGSAILGYIQQVAEGEAGIVFCDAAGNLTFHDKNHRTTNPRSTVSQGLFGDQTLLALPYTALAPAKDKDHIANDWTVTDSGGGNHQLTDDTSISRFFRRPDSLSTFLASGDADTMVEYLLSRTASPGYRFQQMELTPNRNLGLWQQAVNREIGDRVTVQRQPAAINPGTQIQVDCWVERIEWHWQYDQATRIRWQLSPVT